jgi:hypothetical protein
MIEVLKKMVEALEWCHGGEPVGTAEAIQAGKQAIAELESQEPVAWRWQRLGQEWILEGSLKQTPIDAVIVEPLYTHPPQRKPLTDFMVEMSKVLDNYNEQNIFIDGWLSAEAAHGIKE